MHLLPADQNRSDGNTFAHEWRSERGPMAKTSREVFAFREFVFRIGREVVHVDGVPVDHGSPGYPVAADAYTFFESIEHGQSPIRRYHSK